MGTNHLWLLAVVDIRLNRILDIFTELHLIQKVYFTVVFRKLLVYGITLLILRHINFSDILVV